MTQELNIQIHSFRYDTRDVLKEIYIQIAAGEHVCILGESGCGKSTLLHLIYGLLPLKYGVITYADKKLLGPKATLIPGEPFMKLVAQDFDIMPYATVAENINSHLSGLNPEKDQARIEELLLLVNLQDFKDVKAKTLSGGQKQRVALAKALAKEPEVLLLDEPFSNIDSFLKNSLRRKLYAYLKKKNITCITATHDSQEALAFSDHLILLNQGKVELAGKPETVYQNLSTPYQASFFEEVNVLPKKLFMAHATGEMLVFPYQLKISKDHTPLEVSVQHCYFQGRNYLIQGKGFYKTVFFESPTFQPLGRRLFLRYEVR